MKKGTKFTIKTIENNIVIATVLKVIKHSKGIKEYLCRDNNYRYFILEDDGVIKEGDIPLNINIINE